MVTRLFSHTPYTPAGWNTTLQLDVKDVWNGIFLHALLLDQKERQDNGLNTVLQLDQMRVLVIVVIASAADCEYEAGEGRGWERGGEGKGKEGAGNGKDNRAEGVKEAKERQNSQDMRVVVIVVVVIIIHRGSGRGRVECHLEVRVVIGSVRCMNV